MENIVLACTGSLNNRLGEGADYKVSLGRLLR